MHIIITDLIIEISINISNIASYHHPISYLLSTATRDPSEMEVAATTEIKRF
jgi:hypothetical protein